jgi:hypothetical protein
MDSTKQQRTPLLTVLRKIDAALKHAEKKHSKWPDDLARQVLIVGEEFGEVQQAALDFIQFFESDWSIDFAPDMVHYRELAEKIDNEMVQVAAMAIRFLMSRI